MSIFGNIMGAIFGHAQAQAPAPQRSTSGMQTAAGGTAQSQGGQQSQRAGTAGATAPIQQIDVEPILDKLTASKQEKLDWRHSIVDLMKALDLDSSFAARKELANEMNYSGDPNDSAAMNIWLHKQVMIKLAENGGKVPESLKN
jgi:hypothetical protein